MDTDGFDVYPILHKGRLYNVITKMDMTFREVRAVLDGLIARGAFRGEDGEGEPGMPYSCPVEGDVFVVDVQGYDVVVLRREPAK
ncbi:MAG: hypothetical protein HZB86_04645 [Deltaproteobacteria bacterium]|nr:hypothetical protein [Deltaproteobacteria bacterium]